MKLRNFGIGVMTIIFVLVGLSIFGQETQHPVIGEPNESFVGLVLGEGVTLLSFFVFTLFGIGGLITSVCFDIYSSGASAKNFSLKYWWSSNKWRIMLSLMVVMVAIIFSEQLVGMKMSTWSSFIAGFTADKLIENLMQRKRRKEQIKERENE